MRKNILTLFLFGFSLLLIAPACHIDYDHDEADVRLHWTFDGHSCHWAGVTEVELILERERSGRLYRTGMMDCRAEWVDFEELDEGKYIVYAYGYRPGERHARWALERKLRLYRGFNEYTLVLEPY